MLQQTLEYVRTKISQLPDFYATRVTTHFEDRLSQQMNYSMGTIMMGGSLSSIQTQAVGVATTTEFQKLHSTGEYPATVTYRDGHEVIDENTGKRKEAVRQAPGLTTSGEFGPILGAVIDDLLHSGLRWQRWERGPSGPAAVFSYAVAAGDSHFAVGITNGNKVETTHPAYHGEVEIDPETGAILSLIEVADMAPPHQAMRAAMAVDYAPVTIGNGSFICPVRAVAFSEIPVPTVGGTNEDSAPVQINLNDVAFTQYHRFGTETRLISNAGGNGGNDPAEGSQTQAAEVRGGAISPGTPAATSAPDAAAGTADPFSAGTAAVVTAQPAVTPIVNSTAAQIAQAAAAPAENSSSTKEAEPAAASAASPASTGNTKDALARGTVLHVESKLVLVDVVVTDHDRPIRSLSRDRFHILEDGHEQPIASFEEHEPSARITVAEPPALPSNTYSNVPAYPETSAVNVLLLDALNTPMGDQERVRRAMIEYLGTIRPGTPLAIFTLSSRLRMAAGFTTDVAQLANVLQRQKAKPHAPAGAGLSGGSSLSTSLTQEASQINATSGDPGTAWLASQIMDFAADNKTHENDERAMITLNALSQLSQYLAAIPGRKNLIWFSGSFPAGLTPGALNNAPLKDVSDYSAEMRRTDALLTAARVSVYPVDARGVMTAPTADATYIPPPAGMGSASPRFGVQSDNNSFSVQTLQDQGTMDTIATETGGHAYSTGNDLGEALKKIIATDSSYYALSYVPPEEKKDTKGSGFHRIEVKVNGARYQLAYRRGYYADDTRTLDDTARGAASLITEAMELGAPPSTQILFRAGVLQANDPQFMGAVLDDKTAGEKATGFPGGIHRYVVDLSVQTQSLTFAEGAGGARSTQLQCGLAAYNGQGEAMNSLFRTFDVHLTSEEYERLRATKEGIPVRLALDLPAGEVALRIVVYAPGTAKTGSLEIPVQTTSELLQGKH
jgi:VWFA-related protein